MSVATATKPQPLDLKRLRALAALLASEHDGEVVNAARALVRAAAASGLKVQEIISLPSMGHTGAPAQRRHEAEQTFSDLMGAFHAAMAQGRAQGNAEYDAAVQRERQRHSSGFRPMSDVEKDFARKNPGAQFKSWIELRDRIRNRVVGTNILNDHEEAFIFARLAYLEARNESPTPDEIDRLYRIAQKLNII